jgi:uncharacterized protein
MKKILLAAALASVVLPAAACAQARPDADPAIWVVKDEDTTIYLFGTFHMLDGKRDWFNEEVKTAFDQSQELVLEALIPENQAELQPLILKYAIDPNGKTLSSRLTPEVKAKLEKELPAGMPLQAVDPLEPWFISTLVTTLGAQKLGLTPENGTEAILRKAAKAGGKSVGELEGVEYQLGIFDKIPEDLQVAMLEQALDSSAKLGELFNPMMAAWADGDTETLVRLMNTGMNETPELYKTIFSDRNAKWAEWIDARLDKPGTVFMAVGAGHLAGKDSVQDILAAKGIKAGKVEG